jgi:energy-coupling factor transport system substrate-specific component
MTTTTDRTESTATDQASARWRTVDIVVASALGVAFGVVFWAWNTLWNGLEGAFAGFPPGRAFLYGMWMVPAVLGPLVIRKRGAAVYVELVASVVSALLGSPWGLYVVAYGLIQGAAGELVFALTLYRSWRLPTAVLAGAAAGAAAALMDLAFYYPDWSGVWQLTYGVLVVVSAAVVAGGGSWLLVRALARTGVLSPFPSGADQARV